MIKVKNKTLDITAILENAYNIGYDKASNQLWTASFSLPVNDPKNEKVKQLQFVEIVDVEEYIGLFRIMPKLTKKSTSEITYSCIHVLSTLMDDVLFGYMQLDGQITTVVINELLSKQTTPNWVLGECDFTRYFAYSWENENGLLDPLFSIPKTFDEDYIFTFNTQVYPWVINLKHPDNTPVCRVQETYNIIDFEVEENPNSLVNRIYPLGYGEGVNQLNIASINTGKPYIEDAASIAEFGLVEYVWCDRRFVDQASLKSSAEALLRKWKEPTVSWKVSVADVSSITGIAIDQFKIDRVVRINTEKFGIVDARILKLSKSDITGDPGAAQLEIGNVMEDLGTTSADLERRQQINELYSQGATNIYTYNYQDNADSTHPATLRFFIDDDVVNINTVELTYANEKYRAYSGVTESAGQIIQVTTTEAGGASTQTSNAGGGGTQTSSGGGGGTSGAVTDNGLFPSTGVDVGIMLNGLMVVGSCHDVNNVALQEHKHMLLNTHTHDMPSHTHSVTAPAHTHSVNIPSHVHGITISIPPHNHEIKHEIVELNRTAGTLTVIVDGEATGNTDTSEDRLDIVDYLEKDTGGKITRGWHTVEIQPDDLARITAQLTLRVFIKSQLGGKF